MHGPRLAQHGQWKPAVVVSCHADGCGGIDELDQARFYAGPAVGDIVFTVARKYRPVRHPSWRPGLDNPSSQVFRFFCDHVDRAVTEHGKSDPESRKPDWFVALGGDRQPGQWFKP